MNIFFTLILYLIAPSVFAGLIDPPPTDKSVEFLGSIFGSNIGHLYLGGAPNPVLAEMFQLFNIVVVTLATAVLSYTGVVSTLNTAQDGQAMGKKWSSIWLPLRSFIGMLLMLPSPQFGYSVIQTLVMWLVMQGIGAADNIWNLVLNQLDQGVSATTAVKLQNDDEYIKLQNDARNLVSPVLNAQICVQSMKKFSRAHRDHRGFFADAFGANRTGISFEPPTKSSTGQNNATLTGRAYFGVKDNPNYKNICGQFNITAESNFSPDWDNASDRVRQSVDGSLLEATANKSYRLKKDALIVMASTLAPLAEKIISGKDVSKIEKGYMQQATNAYAKTISNLRKPGQTSTWIERAIDQGKRSGWISAGSFYFVLNTGQTSALLETAKVVPTTANIPGARNINQSNIGNNLNNTERTSLRNSLLTAKRYLRQEKNDINNGNTARLSSLNFENQDDDSSEPDIEPAKKLLRQAMILLGDLMEGGTEKDSALDDNISKAQAQIKQGKEKYKDFRTSIENNLTRIVTTNGTDPLLSQAKFGLDLMQGAELAWAATINSGTFVDKLAPEPPDLSKEKQQKEELEKEKEKLTKELKDIGGAGQEVREIDEQIANIDKIIKDKSSKSEDEQTSTLKKFNAMLLGGTIAISTLGLLWAAGTTLAVYLPFIPYMMFTVASLGWLLLIIEAIVAAPIIALGLVIPSGEELGKIQHALMLLINIFLRPILMIFGFILSARVYHTIVDLVHFGMSANLSGMDLKGSMVAWVPTMILYAAFVIAIANKCFALIYILPDKILRWVGGGPEHSDASQELQASKHGADSAIKQASAPMAGFAKTKLNESLIEFNARTEDKKPSGSDLENKGETQEKEEGKNG